MKKEIPCRTKKCILYPLCIDRVYIECLELYNWLAREANTETNWKHINDHLAKCVKVMSGVSNFAYPFFKSRPDGQRYKQLNEDGTSTSPP